MNKKGKSILNRIKKGYGQGKKENYKPWLSTFDFSSLGRSCITSGLTIDRPYYFLSDLEADYFDMIDIQNSITDIQEQFPLLNYGLCYSIARELGIKPPIGSGNNEPYILTSDFRITYLHNKKEKIAIRTVKPRSELEKPRVIEKFLIEKEYWQREEGIFDWKIITEDSINSTIVKNVRDIKSCRDLKQKVFFSDWSDSKLNELIKQVYLLIKDETDPSIIKNLLESLNKSEGLCSGSTKTVYRYLLSTKIIQTDLTIDRLGLD